MAQEGVNRPERLPRDVYHRGKLYDFDMVCPITGDGVYKDVDSKGIVHHLLLPNEDAWDQQTRVLAIGV